MNMTEALHALEKDPDTIATVHSSEFMVGRRDRKRVRAAFEAVKAAGARVEWHEEWGLFDSCFAFQMAGVGVQLLDALRVLVPLSGEPPVGGAA